jgi:hypothetical protein
MSVWFCIPSKRPPEKSGPILDMWKRQGYNIALWRDCGDPEIEQADLTIHRTKYRGYAEAVNQLVSQVLAGDHKCQWIVTGGDDVEPDLNLTADQIAMSCSRHFADVHANPDCGPGVEVSVKSIRAALDVLRLSTFGVMQPTGDRWGADEDWAMRAYPDAPAYIDRICGSPWMGREFCLRINGGRGPLWSEYTHMFVDEELQNVAKRLGILWQRRDLIHYHRHWGRSANPSRDDIPSFLAEVNSAAHWMASKELFETRLKAGFPGSEPL